MRRALEAGRALRIRYYTAGRDVVTDRTIDPMRLVLVEGRGYLEAWCRRAEAVRLFRLDRVEDVAELDEDTHVYAVRGELFFATSNDLYSQFDYVGAPKNVVIDLTDAHVWDASTVAALDAIEHKFRSRGKNVEIVGLDDHSAHMLDRLSGHLGAGH